MQLKSVKSAADLPFPGVEIVKADASIKEVIINGKLHIRGDYGMTVMVRTEGEEAKRHKVTAKIEGFGDKVEYFQKSYEASSAKSRYEALGATVEVSEVTVLVDEFGTVVEGSERDATLAKVNDDDIGF